VSPAAAACFGHFCALLHLELLEEVAAIRRRLERCTGAQLQRQGRALLGARATSVVDTTRPRRVG
jgi:hypothetical protein